METDPVLPTQKTEPRSMLAYALFSMSAGAVAFSIFGAPFYTNTTRPAAESTHTDQTNLFETKTSAPEAKTSFHIAYDPNTRPPWEYLFPDPVTLSEMFGMRVVLYATVSKETGAEGIPYVEDGRAIKYQAIYYAVDESNPIYRSIEVTKKTDGSSFSTEDRESMTYGLTAKWTTGTSYGSKKKLVAIDGATVVFEEVWFPDFSTPVVQSAEWISNDTRILVYATEGTEFPLVELTRTLLSKYPSDL